MNARRQIAVTLPVIALLCGIAAADPCTPHWDQRIGQPGTDDWVQGIRGLDGGLGPTLYIGGGFTVAGDMTVNRITKWNGADFGTFGTGIGLGNGAVWSFEVYDDGSGGGPAVYAGGDFSFAGGVQVNRIAKWDGSSWSSLAGGLSAEVRGGMKVWDDGSGPAIFMGGDFATAGGHPVNSIAKWNGTAWADLAGGMSGPFKSVRGIAIYDDGLGGGPALYACGRFQFAGGVTVDNIGRWNGTSWSPVGVGPTYGTDAICRILATHTDSTGSYLVMGGDFLTLDGQSINRIAIWNGHVWAPLGAGMNGPVRGIVSYDDGTGSGPRIYAAGSFTHADGKLVNYIAMWDGHEWQSLGAGLNNAVFDMTIYDDGSGEGPAIYPGGPFTQADGVPCAHVARYVGCQPRPPCAPDLNDDGLVDFADYLVFLTLYDAADPRVDFTADGFVDFSDYLEFLNLFEAGC